MRIIRHFKALGFREDEEQELRNSCPYELDRAAYHWFDGDVEFYVVFYDESEEQYTLN